MVGLILPGFGSSSSSPKTSNTSGVGSPVYSDYGTMAEQISNGRDYGPKIDSYSYKGGEYYPSIISNFLFYRTTVSFRYSQMMSTAGIHFFTRRLACMYYYHHMSTPLNVCIDIHSMRSLHLWHQIFISELFHRIV